MNRLALCLLLLIGSAGAQQTPKSRVCNASGQCAGVTGGALDVNATVSATTAATATAALATCTEGQTDCPLSVDLNRQLRISGTINANSTATATAAAPSYGEGTAQPVSQDLAGYSRTRSLHTTAPSPLACRLSDGTNFLTSLAVTGTFWQATQPVSGTFWQATQPVSGTVTVTDGAGALNVIVDSGTTAATQSGTWTVQPGNTANTTAWLVAGGVADNAAAASTNLATLPAIVETSSTPITRTDGNRAALIVDADGKAYVRNFDWDPLSASSGLSTATTLTELIAAPGASVSIYITSWKCSSSAASTATTDQQCTIKRGTGTACATGTTYVDGCFQTANGGCASSFDGGPIKITANNALCWIHAATGSKIVTVNYFLAP